MLISFKDYRNKGSGDEKLSHCCISSVPDYQNDSWRACIPSQVVLKIDNCEPTVDFTCPPASIRDAMLLIIYVEIWLLFVVHIPDSVVCRRFHSTASGIENVPFALKRSLGGLRQTVGRCWHKRLEMG